MCLFCSKHTLLNDADNTVHHVVLTMWWSYGEEAQQKNRRHESSASVLQAALDFGLFPRYRDKNVMRPFAFRTHTHALGVRNIAYRVRNGTWTLIGQKSPQAPEAFYPVKNKHITIEKGDWLVRCKWYVFLQYFFRVICLLKGIGSFWCSTPLRVPTLNIFKTNPISPLWFKRKLNRKVNNVVFVFT